MKRIVSVFVLICVTAGLLSACSDNNSESGIEAFVKGAFESILPEYAYDAVIKNADIHAIGEFSLKNLYFTDVDTAEKARFDNVFDGEAIIERSREKTAYSGFLKNENRVVDFYGNRDSSSFAATVSGLTDNPFLLDISSFLPVTDYGTFLNQLKDLYTVSHEKLNDTLSSVTPSSEDVEFDGEGVEKHTYILAHDKSVIFADTVLAKAFNENNILSEGLGEYFYGLNNITAGDKSTYYKNLISAITDNDSFVITVEKYIDGGNTVKTEVISSCDDNSLCRTFEFTETEKVTAVNYENHASETPIFSLALSEGNYTFSFADKYTLAYAKQEQCDNMTSDILVHIPDFAEGINIKVSFEKQNNGCKTVLNIRDENETFGADFNITLSETDKNAENSPVTATDTLTNDIEGADVYDSVADALVADYPGIEKLIPTGISVAPEFDETYAAKIGEDYYSLSAYLFFLQQNRDYYEYVARNYYTDRISADEDIWNIVLDDGQKIGDYVYEVAEQEFVSSYYITKYFNESDLTLPLSSLAEAKDNLYATYTHDTIEDFCNYIGCTEKGFRYLYAVTDMQTRIFDYFYGAAGTKKPTRSDLLTYFDGIYAGFKTVLIFNFKLNEDGYENYDTSELKTVRSTAKSVYKQVTQGKLTMDDAIKQYSDDYKYTLQNGYAAGFDNLTAEEYMDMLLAGVVVNPEGECAELGETFVYPDIVMDKLFDMNVGDFGYIEDSENGFWIFERTDISDKFDNYEYECTQGLTANLEDSLLSDWRETAVYEMNTDVVSQYRINKIEPVFYSTYSDNDDEEASTES